MPIVDAEAVLRILDAAPDPLLLEQFPDWSVERYGLVPLLHRGDHLVVAFDSHPDEDRLAEASYFSEVPIEPVVVSRATLDQALWKHYRILRLDSEARPSRWHKHSVTFAVAEVTPATQPLAETSLWNQMKATFESIESCEDFFRPVVAREQRHHALFDAAYMAFCQHRPLVLSPDMLWITMAQGFSTHINRNSDHFRHHFVKEQSRLKLVVERPDFVLGSPENPWQEVFQAFSQQIRGHVGPAMHDLLAANFSTTGPVERAASEVVLMDTLQSIFQYSMLCICGLPTVTLEGSVQDWQDLHDRAQSLRRFELDWWIDALTPVLEHFVRASRGEVDRAFWNDLYQRHDPETRSYGGPYEKMSGWLSRFSPYLRDGSRNPHLLGSEDPLEVRQLPSGVSCVPLRLAGRREDIDLEFLAGLLAVEQDRQTLALRPKISWVVRRAAEEWLF